MEENQLIAMGVIALAYMGDTLYEVRVREHVIQTCPGQKVRSLHQAGVGFVKASAQALAVMTMMEEGFLNEEELAMVRRGRNRSANPPKNADPSDYRYATGFETLLGYLYFKGAQERMEEIIDRAIEILKK